MVISMSSFLEPPRGSASWRFRRRPAGFPGLFPETVEHVDRIFKLGDVHHPEPPIGAVDTNLVGAWSNLGKGSPVIGDFAPLQLSQFVARLLPRRFGKRAQVVERRSSPVDRLVHLASMYQILYRGASVRLTSFCSHERASKVDQNKREKLFHERWCLQRPMDDNSQKERADARDVL